MNTQSRYVQPSAGSLDATVDVSLSEMGCIVQRSRGLIGIEKRGQEVWVAGNVALDGGYEAPVGLGTLTRTTAPSLRIELAAIKHL